MDRLNGWKTIAAYLRRDERTARRWAAESGMPVYRMPGPGRGSVYAVAEEIDAWIEADRAQAACSARPISTTIAPVGPPVVTVTPLAWWRRRRTTRTLIASGALLAAIGALTLHYSSSRTPPGNAISDDPVARTLFLQASYDWNLRSPVSLTRAVREYGATIARDPRMPAAYIGLANSYLLLREYGTMPDADAYMRAQAAARAAVALAPSSADAHRALAFIAFWWREDRATARREFARALELKPDDPLTHHWFATALLANGESGAALREIERARELDPEATAILADEGLIQYAAGYRAEGITDLRDLAREQTDAISPHRWLAEIALSEGRMADFLRESVITARLRSDAGWLSQARRLEASGLSPESIKEIMLRNAEQSGAGWFQIARLAALAGDRTKAKDAIQRACETHEPAAISAGSDLLLARVLSKNDIETACGRAAPLI
ncbi:hypothetical protein F9288_09560 [Sphingomonas sp. CL5.1]|uniref:hypothetical protein n=1 Tax=Sphingomonas sp. CL5.1 TaxID=2653203 RepID=UPI00158158F2|nr:hypothetical protein [Sphingomonas sp. CL5.1]QKR99855.1 hypothetical protein F9288_09560 [Sphingomonas sp. CL5.1]